MGGKKIKYSRLNKLTKMDEDSEDDFTPKCPFDKEEDDTMSEYHKRFGGPCSSTVTVQKSMSTTLLTIDNNTDDEKKSEFKVTKENIFSKEYLNIHSKGRVRKKALSAPALKIIKDPAIKRQKLSSKTEATKLARQMTSTQPEYVQRLGDYFPVKEPKGSSFCEENVSNRDNRDQNKKTNLAIAHLFFSAYNAGEGVTRFQCMLCYTEKIISDKNKNIKGTFSSTKSFRFHFMRFHGTEADRSVVCPHDGCDERFPNQSHLDVHLPSHSEIKTVKCLQCDLKFRDKCTMMFHYKNKHTQGAHQCSDCSESFASNTVLMNHRSHNHPESLFQCTCGACFRSFKNLVPHIQTAHLNKDLFNCEECGRTILLMNKKRHEKWHNNNKNYYCSLCETEVEDSAAYILHVKEKDHQQLLQDTFSTNIYPHAIPLDDDDPKPFYPHVEYDLLDKYNNNIFIACSPEKECRACEVITVASTVYYLSWKWVVRIPTVPFNCATSMSLYLTLLTNENKNGKFIQYRYAGQTQKSSFGKRVEGHENGDDGKQTARVFADTKSEGWRHDYIFMHGCPEDKKEVLQIEFGERNLIKQFQSQDKVTYGVNIQDGGTFQFISELKNAGLI